MKICIVSFYFPPDLCAGSFRAEALVKALLKFNNEISEIEILTTSPNRYSSHLIETENEVIKSNKITIKRVKVPKHNSGLMGQSIAFLFFAFGVLIYSRSKKWNLVVATSSRLMTACLGAIISKNKKIPLYLDIRDLFVDTMNNVLSKSHLRHILVLFKYIEKLTFNAAHTINIVSQGFENYLNVIVNNKKITFHTNGIDNIFLKNTKRNTKISYNKNIDILYAGNIGSGQALHSIIPQSAKLLDKTITFTIVGDGGKKEELERALEKYKVKNVKIINPVDRIKLFQYYNKTDILFIHLNDLPAFKKVLPSKLFEYASLNKPIIAGVDGFASSFISKEVSGSEIFQPCDVNSFLLAFKKVISNKQPINRSSFIKKYTRTEIMNIMAKEIIKIGKNG